jgi:hypothetical protein
MPIIQISDWNIQTWSSIARILNKEYCQWLCPKQVPLRPKLARRKTIGLELHSSLGVDSINILSHHGFRIFTEMPNTTHSSPK